jgi:excisionase family DNA binding protein
MRPTPNQNSNTSLPSVRPVLRKAEVAQVLGVHPATIDRWVAQGRLPPPQRIGSVPYWRPEVIEAALKAA